MKAIIRNLISVVRRFRLAMLLNILGLSVAFAAFMVIMIQLNYDYGFDRFHKDYDKIFRVERVSNEWGSVLFSRPFAERFFESSPHIIAGTIVPSWESKTFFWVENDVGERHYYEENSLFVMPEFFDVFTFDFVEGGKDERLAPQSTFIPLSLARKLFGNEPLIGKQIFVGGWGPQTVIGVYRDLPPNSIIQNCIYFAMQPHENRNNWGNMNYAAFIRVDQASNARMLFDNFKQHYDGKEAFGSDFEWAETSMKLRFTALSDVHFVSDLEYDRTPKASRQTLMILFTIAIAIIAIACINFTNFSTALTPMRIKNINTQRILGAQLNTMRLSLVFEAVFFCILAYIFAIWLFLLFKITPLASLIDPELSLSGYPLIVGGTALIALLTGVITGLYPAFYMTSFEPALVLKGSFGLSPKGKKIRNTLIGIQYIASISLIIGTGFMYLQNHFMQNSTLGYDKDEVLISYIGGGSAVREVYIQKLKEFPGIEDVTFGENHLSTSDQYMGWGRQYKGEDISFQVIPVDYTFLKVMGIEVIEGRDFRREDAAMEFGVFVFNETARRRNKLEINTMIEGQGEIIGFIPDVKFASFRKEVEPMAFYVWGTTNWGDRLNCAYIKVNAGVNIRAAILHIQSTNAELIPNYPIPIEVRLYSEVLQSLYEKERALGSLISLFSILAIFISIVGVFGLVVFDSECRRKEIGIRKVLGASTLGIIIMFNKAYFKILMICFVVAAPLARYAVTRWLENFAYKTPMYWWVYLVALVAVGAITVSTVTFQNWRVANEDPVKSIKSE